MKKILALLLIISSWAAASETSPYFQIHGERQIDTFPLKSSHSEVTITGPLARVELTQSYQNEGDEVLDATYLFPASSGSAVHGMTLKIGDRTITAQIQEKQQARETFEKAKKENKSASLLTQKRPNLFSMEVARILPGDTVTLTLHYSELLTPQSGTYEFLIPTAIGPRYHEGAKTAAAVSNPFLNKGQKTLTRFSANLKISSPLPLQNLACPTHDLAKITFTGKNEASLTLPPTDPDRDFIVRYQLANTQIQTGLLTHHSPDQTDNTFLLQLEPPRDISPQDIPERDFIFVIDVSGSMTGFPLNLAKSLFNDLSKTLRPEDRFNLLLFAGANQLLSPKSLHATPANLTRATNFLKSYHNGGGTRLLDALKRALELPHDHDRARSLVLISDGYIDAETDVFDLVRDQSQGTNIFPLGVGSSVNRHLLEGLSHFAGRDHFIVTHPNECADAAQRFRNIISTPVLTNIRIESDDLTLTDLLPARQPDLFAGQPLSLIGKFSGTGTITMTGTTGNGKTITQNFDIDKPTTRPALPILWARNKVRELSDFAALTNRESETQQVTELGLKYQLLTPFTSFVAVSPEARENTNNAVAITQAQPLPKGVSNSAVGTTTTTSGSVPEPSATLLFMLVGLLTLTLRVRS